MSINEHLGKIGRRIRIVRAWRWLAYGLIVGALASVVALAGRYLGYWVVSWPEVLIGVGVFALAGLMTGFFWKLSEKDIARSIDDRAELKDRTISASTLTGMESAFAAEVNRDAVEQLEKVNVSQAYPIRMGNWHYAAFSSAILAVAGVWLLTSGVLDSAETKKAKEELAKASETVERIARDLTEQDVDVEIGAEEKELGEAMRRFAKQLNYGQLDEEEAMQKANELAQEAEKLSRERFDQLQDKMQSLRSQLADEKLKEADLSKKDLQNLDLDPRQMALMQQLMQKSGADQMQGEDVSRQAMNDLEMSENAQALTQLSDEQRKALAEQMAKEMSGLQERLNDPNLTQSEREQLEQMMQDMENLSQQMELSEEVQKAIEEFMNSPEMQELQKLMQEMMEKAEASQNGEEISQEDIDRMREQMEKLAEQLKDPAMREQIKKQMEEMLEALKNGELTMQAVKQMAQGMGASMLAQSGVNGQQGGNALHGGSYQGEGDINKSDEEWAPGGKTTTTAVRGKRDDERGTEEYIEIKAPTMMGNKTSVPYKEALPKYKKQAESAIGEKKVSKKNEKKVKEYFESLGGKKKK